MHHLIVVMKPMMHNPQMLMCTLLVATIVIGMCANQAAVCTVGSRHAL